MAEHEVTVTRTINASASSVWAALTEPQLVSRWMMGALVDSTWEEGEPITWTGEYEGKKFTDKGEVLESDRLRRLVYTHFSALSGDQDRPENYHRLDWQLTPEDGATKLELIQSGAASPEQAEAFKKNWSAMLDGLKNVAES